MTDNVNCKLDMEDFLTNSPPGEKLEIKNLYVRKRQFDYVDFDRPNHFTLNTPELNLFCMECKGERTFRCNHAVSDLSETNGELEFIVYCCSNCQYDTHVFALELFNNPWRCRKIGEYPSRIPSTPRVLLDAFDKNNKALFFKGIRCEKQGLGIGAYSYYRRVVENYKEKIFDQIIRIAKMVNAPQEEIDKFVAAKHETQFKKALKIVKDFIPESLKINNYNPLQLLHNALSDGLHGRTDEECLKLAHDVRIILFEVSDRINKALKDDKEVTAAVSALAQIPQPNNVKNNPTPAK